MSWISGTHNVYSNQDLIYLWVQVLSSYLDLFQMEEQ